jgi:hypothetical protein
MDQTALKLCKFNQLHPGAVFIVYKGKLGIIVLDLSYHLKIQSKQIHLLLCGIDFLSIADEHISVNH